MGSKVKKFLIKWKEEIIDHCTVEIEANSKEEALSKWKDVDFSPSDTHSQSVDAFVIEGSESAEELT